MKLNSYSIPLDRTLLAWAEYNEIPISEIDPVQFIQEFIDTYDSLEDYLSEPNPCISVYTIPADPSQPGVHVFCDLTHTKLT